MNKTNIKWQNYKLVNKTRQGTQTIKKTNLTQQEKIRAGAPEE